MEEVLGADQGQLNLLCTDTSLPGSQLTTMDINNDRTGVTEKHAYRRMFDDRIDFTFYVDASNYLPIRFFETWMKGIMNEDDPFASGGGPLANVKDSKSINYHYKPTYPDEYTADQGLKIFKFENSKNYYCSFYVGTHNKKSGNVEKSLKTQNVNEATKLAKEEFEKYHIENKDNFKKEYDFTNDIAKPYIKMRLRRYKTELGKKNLGERDSQKYFNYLLVLG